MTSPKDIPTHRVPTLKDRGVKPTFLADGTKIHTPDDTLLGIPHADEVVKELTGIAGSEIARTIHGIPAITIQQPDADKGEIDSNNQTSLGIGPNPSATKIAAPAVSTTPATDDTWFDIDLGDLPSPEVAGNLRGNEYNEITLSPKLDEDTANLFNSPVPILTPKTLEIEIVRLNSEIERLEKEVEKLTRLLSLAKDERAKFLNSIVETNKLVAAHKKMVEKYNALCDENEALDARITALTLENQKLTERLAANISIVSSEPGSRIQQFRNWVRVVFSKFK